MEKQLAILEKLTGRTATKVGYRQDRFSSRPGFFKIIMGADSFKEKAVIATKIIYFKIIYLQIQEVFL